MYIRGTLAKQFWLMKRFFYEKVGRGRQPYIWKPVDFPLQNIPTSKVGFKGLVNRIRQRWGPGRYFILREQFEGEKPMFRPVVYFVIRFDGKYRIVKRYTQFKAVDSDTQPFWKLHQRRLRLGMDMKERLRQMRRAILDSLKHEIQLAQPFEHEIVSHTRKGWKIAISTRKSKLKH
jgi:hypothetical protein